MRQYLEVKERYPDCIVFFRVGDFYELFFNDAVTAARALDLTLTTRDKGKEDAVPMAGVPHHALRQYLGKMIERGYKVAICDQVEDPKLAKGIVRREVTRVVTPGVLIDEEQLEAKESCYLAAIAPGAEWQRVGFAYLDVSTGEFAATELDGAALEDELARVGPRELLIPPSLESSLRQLIGQGRALTEFVPAETAGADTGAGTDAALLEDLFGAKMEALGLASWPLAVQAAATCVRYARSTQPAGSLPLHRIRPYQPSEHLVIDETTQLHLELFAPLSSPASGPGGGMAQGELRRRATLFGILDQTRTAMGGRLLRRWLGAPLLGLAPIRRRQDAVEWLVEHAALRATLRAELGEVYDLERLCGRAMLGVATPRDLAALRRSLERLPAIAQALGESVGPCIGAIGELPELLGPRPDSDLAADVAADIAATLVDDPPVQWAAGGIIRRGAAAELDEIVDIAEHGKERLLGIEARERERTGIGSLKVRYNKVFGYYLEITRTHMARVPADYVRKQTLANCERYTTPELTEYESKILGAEERRAALEQELFAALRTRVAAHGERLHRLAEVVAILDAVAALADVAHAGGYVRPEVDESSRLEITEGRHPVVEKLAAAGKFVPNDVALDPDDAQLMVITGPNMAGKSTVMRQVALIVLLAQTGSFVPATRARVGVVDRIFTRVGASDNLARGESTFMVEMRETGHILRHATRRSLILLDEIGRGTSTYDGVSIAWAVAEYLHDRIGARTMFATHYHELVALARSRPRVRNWQVAVREWKDEVVFLHRLAEGGASRSYGIQVARLAGLPQVVIERARAVLAALERGEDAFGRARPLAGIRQMELFAAPVAEEAQPEPPTPPPGPSPAGESTLSPAAAGVLRSLREADPDDLSPRAAHALLQELRQRLLAG
jgi:DNA mismatch repair protein MutS